MCPNSKRVFCVQSLQRLPLLSGRLSLSNLIQLRRPEARPFRLFQKYKKRICVQSLQRLPLLSGRLSLSYIPIGFLSASSVNPSPRTS
ncbi:hypothetical protein SAMN04488137_1853 [Fictibacillus solisalsi]|uniref:Uncharacterized protein n=1 Tax=Fictibacillus solisalsi TaxID=459525 RepID=A0A1G9VYJ9_9BACL|nr:hypothetical protein SAMN04488137_1853 [Fictibacillus solisalsi]